MKSIRLEKKGTNEKKYVNDKSMRMIKSIRMKKIYANEKCTNETYKKLKIS